MLGTDGEDAFELSLARCATRLRVHEFRGREHISKTFSFEVIVSAPMLDGPTIDDCIGRPAHLHFATVGGWRRWLHGVIRQFEIEERSVQDNRCQYRVSIVPSLWFLRKCQNSRIFQGTTVPDIVGAVLGEAGITPRWSLFASHAERSYCVQYAESDLAFIERLLAEEGIVYWFEHSDDPDGEAVMVLADHAGARTPIPGDAELRSWDSDGLIEHEGDVREFRLRRRIDVGSVVLKEFDFVRPSLDLGAEAAVADAPEHASHDRRPFEHYDHHGDYERGELNEALAEVRLEQRRRRVRWAQGASRCARLLPGHSFKLREAHSAELNDEYTVVAVRHVGRDPHLARGPSGGSNVYENTFQCVPATTTFRPKRPARRLQQVLETATVVGPEGAEIHTDEHGRIKVQFHWDRLGQRNEHSSCWIRVMQSWAGSGWGFQFIPRVGMEVMVLFAAGDTDRPMIVGSVPNAEHPLPFPLPAAKSHSGIRTRSTPHSDGYNELSFEDRAGFEQILLRAERDLRRDVKRDDFAEVARNKTTKVGADQMSTVGGSQFEIVEQTALSDVGADRVERTGGSHKMTVDGGVDEQIRGPRSATIGGGARTTVAADLDVLTAGDARSRTEGDLESDTRGDKREHVAGSAVASIHGDSAFAVVGSHRVFIGSTLLAAVGRDGGALRVDATDDGHVATSARKSVDISAGDSLNLRVGKSRIHITKDQILVDAKALVLSAENIQLVTDGASLTMNGALKVSADEVELASDDDAKLKLASNAELHGSAVKLASASGSSAASRPSDETRDATDQATVVRLFDRQGRLMSRAKYELTAGGHAASGTTNDGTVRVPFSSRADACRLRWGPPDEPDFAYESEVYLKVDIPGDVNESTRRKLMNLGYHCHSLDEMVNAYELDHGRSNPRPLSDVAPDVSDRHGGGEGR